MPSLQITVLSVHVSFPLDRQECSRTASVAQTYLISSAFEKKMMNVRSQGYRYLLALPLAEILYISSLTPLPNMLPQDGMGE